MVYVSSILLFAIILIISNIIGNFITKYLNLSRILPLELIGFLILISVLFIVSQFLNLGNISSNQLFLIFLIVTIILIIISIRFIRFNYSLQDIGIISAYTLFLIFMSARYTLGEQLGDNVYLFSLVSKNINTSLLNNFDFSTGLVLENVAVSTAKDALTFFHFNSFILHYFYKLKDIFSSEYIPAYVLNMWVNNILFYFFSSSLIVSIIKTFKLKLWTSILVVLFAGLFIGTYYYNITLPHFGVTYLGVGVSVSLLLIWHYLQTKELNYIIVLVLVFFAINSMASTGMLMSAYISFGFISVLIIKKDQYALLYAGLLLIPIVVFANQVKELISVPYLVPIIGLLAVLLVIVNYVKVIKDFIYKYFHILLIALWVILIVVSVIVVPDYFKQILHFSDIKENFDRVRDYFSFTNPYQTLLNLFHYLLLLNIVLNKKTRDFGLVFVFIIVFFINPFSYPLLYKYTEWLYHRSYFVLFNITTLSIGIYALISNLRNVNVILRLPIKIIMTVLIIFFTYTNITTYENVIYIPGEDFNPLYKMNNQQIDVLLELRNQIEENELDNPKVISQIYGTLMIVPEAYHYLFTVSDRRVWNPDQAELFPELYKMMFTPVFPGDDGPRLEMNYWRLCHVLEQEVTKPEYLVFDRSLTFLDPDSGNWLPINWFARGCADLTYENEGYSIYKYRGIIYDEVVE